MPLSPRWPLALWMALSLTSCNLKLAIAKLFISPRDPFDAAQIPAPPDYTDDAVWAALPTLEDAADQVPAGMGLEQQPRASAFYVHPGTLMDRRVWLGDPQEQGTSRDFVDKMLLLEQASLLNGCCAVYAPRYRQVTYGAYLLPIEETLPAFELSYEDIDRAFTEFLRRNPAPQPIVVAAHSQGALHAQRLLKRIDQDPALRERLIAAYVPGNKLPLSVMQAELPNLPVCAAPEQVGCVASWNTYGQDFDPYALDTPLLWQDGTIRVIEPSPLACFNPITGTGLPEAAPSPPEQHLGVVERGPHPWEDLMDRTASVALDEAPLAVTQPGLISARCDDQGILRINDVREAYLPAAEEEEEYHVFDVQLFYLNLRADARDRAVAWWRAQPPAEPPPEPPATPAEPPTP